MTLEAEPPSPARETDATDAREWWRSPFVLLAGGILFLGLIVIVATSVGGGDAVIPAAPSTDGDPLLPLTGPSFGGPDIPETAAVTVTGDSLPRLSPGDDPALGLAAPSFEAISLATGSAVTVGPGTARVIGFFSHWCVQCQAALPELIEWLRNNELPDNSEFLMVSSGVKSNRENYPPSAWFNNDGWGFPVVVDDGEDTLLLSHGFATYPSFIAIDANGAVIARAEGATDAATYDSLFAAFATG